MPTTIWTGSISFGLVTVPVKLTPATKSRDVSFNQLEEGTGARIRLRRVSEQTGEEVAPNNIVKGYEIEKGRYVVVEKSELEALAPKASHTIEIEDFVDLDEIDPLYFDSPYYVLADEKALKPYKLLVDAMTRLQKVAVGRVVIRAKERLVAIRPLDGMLCVETMRYADEVISRDKLEGIPGDDIEVSERELAMATQLVETLSSDFEPDKYHDEYREQLLGLIDQKAAGEEIVAQPEPEAPAKVLDLMAALEASLKRAERDGGSAAAGDREDDEDDEVAPSASAAKSRPRKAAASKAAKKAKPAAAKKAPPKKRTA
ncbi:MAG: non-homologous end joining protein Ku [Acidimicrobiia bacterium]